LPQKSKVLEIGMGPGKDFEILSEDFITTGSDKSEEFFNRYIKKNRNSDVLLLDAVTLETNRFFDCIYTNKVLHLLTKDDLDKSLKRQSEILLDNGLVFHTFWEGEEDRVCSRYIMILKDWSCNLKNISKLLKLNIILNLKMMIQYMLLQEKNNR
ncbi:MAG: methyltransferase domain-containing protein, partial [Candidatus Heimdallarchaeota archaeon]